ncbi:MAG: M1 family metallopeptidase, partial [Thermoanaerobaculia bacterium]
MHLRTLVLALLCALPLAAQNASVDVLHYRVDLEVLKEESMCATAELTVRPVATLSSLQLDFIGLAIDTITVDGRPASFSRDGGKLSIALQPARTEPFRVAIRYHGKPEDGLILRTNKYRDPSAFADNWPNRARHWLPSVDHPSDKATVEFFVTAPAKFDVIANGRLVSTTTLPDGLKRVYWSEPTPIPVHCMVVGATEFTIVDAGPLSYWLYPEDRERGVAQFGRAPQVFDFFTKTIGPYPYEKLALVESSTRFGGMENSSAIFLDEKSINTPMPLEALVAHEIAHQWFGDSVTQRDWHDLWLSEGFATYFANLFYEHADGRAAFVERMRKDRQDYLDAQQRNPLAIHDRSIADLTKLLNRFTYEKGAWVLHMLRGILGDEAFFAAVRDYYAAYRDRNAATSELR